MSSKAQIYLLYLAKYYECQSQELSVQKKSLQGWPNEKQKLEEIITEQSNNSDNLSVHGPSTNTGRYILRENIEGLELSEDSPQGKTVLDMGQNFVNYLEELYICEGEVK